VFSAPSVGLSEKLSLGVILVVLLSFVLFVSIVTVLRKARKNHMNAMASKQAALQLTSSLTVSHPPQNAMRFRVDSVADEAGQTNDESSTKVLEEAASSLKAFTELSEEERERMIKTSAEKELHELIEFCRENLGADNLKLLLSLVKSHPQPSQS
jgi:hypothetical protein